MSIELSLDNTIDYLRSNGFELDRDEARAEWLGGGVSNRVIKVTWGEECVVVKQPYSNLRVEDDWPADLKRVHNEASATRAYGEIISNRGLDFAAVPEVLFEDEENNIIVISCAPETAETWKQELLDMRVEESIGGLTGEVLGTVHKDTSKDKELREKFSNKKPFDQLRIDPYHKTTADRLPEVSEFIFSEVERSLSMNKTLVHGDYSPKNVLVQRSPEIKLWFLDFEVAHWGDPAFDPAFMLNHIFIKSVFNLQNQDKYFETAERFWNSYNKIVDWEIEKEVVSELAILMLARMVGKSPVEYVEDGTVKDTLLEIGQCVLKNDLNTVNGFKEIVRERTRKI